MGNEEHYQKQAALYREQAALRWADPHTAALWTRMAEHYDRLAKQAAQAAGPNTPAQGSPQTPSRAATAAEKG